MKFVLACYGSRGDVEPSVVVGRELQRRGHEVRMAVSPNLVGFTEQEGLRLSPTGWTRRPSWTRSATTGHVASALPGISKS